MQEDRRKYEIALIQIMNNYGVSNEAEVVGGAVIKFHRYHKARKASDLRDRLSDEVDDLWKKTLRCVPINTTLYICISYQV